MAALQRELWEAAVNLRGSIEPADYKRYVLPLIFLRFLSIRYEKHRTELAGLIAEPLTPYFKDTRALEDPDEYRSAGAFKIPEEARWENIVKMAQADDLKVRLDDVLALLEDTYPEKLRGLLPRIYAGSNLSRQDLAGVINLFSKDIFRQDHGGDDLIGRIYEYFIGEFASSEGKRGGEYFTPASIVRTLVAMLEPERGVVYDPCCGSGGMFVQSDIFTKHNGQLSFAGQESKEFTYRLCRMNLFIHGPDGNIKLGSTYDDDRHPGLRADHILANPPFNDSDWMGRIGAGNTERMMVCARARLNVSWPFFLPGFPVAPIRSAIHHRSSHPQFVLEHSRSLMFFCRPFVTAFTHFAGVMPSAICKGADYV
ncbi:MAG TPA: class I SAM-dependent DNA methyltransferase [Candidatus Kapabacteria bacterium]|nr:class I SAM-dependent DNA methyltransferase [Candidatus Kapabacteria bacterium]